MMNLRVLDVLLMDMIEFLAPRMLEAHGNQELKDLKETHPEECSDLPKISQLVF